MIQKTYSPKQLKVMSQANSRWNVLIGAVRSGKTFVTCDLMVKRMLGQPRGNCLLVGKTEKTLARNVLDPMRERFGPSRVGWIDHHGTVKLFGRSCYVVGANDERAVQKIQGLGLVYAYGDEFPTWPESFFNMLKSRLSMPGAKCDLTGNPEGPNHWAKVNFIDHAVELGVKYWHFVLDDNIYLDEEFKAAIKREYTGMWYQRYILGLWVAAEGAVYDMLDTSVHVVHNLPEMRRHWVGVDYGTASVTTFWLLGLGADNKLYFTDFLRWDAKAKRRQKTDLELALDLENWLESHRVYPQWIFIPDDAASFMAQCWALRKQRQGERKRTSLENLAYADRSPGSVLDGIRDVSTLLSAGVLFFSREIERKGGLDEWIGYVWDGKTDAKPVKQSDHGPDAGRYVIRGTERVWREILGKGVV